VKSSNRYLRFGIAITVIVASLGYLAFTGAQESKSYYVTIKELRGMGDQAYAKKLRVAGNVVPGSIKRQGSGAEFTLQEETQTLQVVYRGSEPPPDTFKDNSQALAIGTFGRDGAFHARELQAKCASKYAPAPGNSPTQTQPPPTQKADAKAANSGY
jgi:cytochrome c-type biogenesis protein CcmE